jgi:hypothetical protein
MVLAIEDGLGSKLEVAGDPLKIRDAVGATADVEHRFPPRLGADAGAVLAELLGLDTDTVAGLARDGVIGSRRPGAP